MSEDNIHNQLPDVQSPDEEEEYLIFDVHCLNRVLPKRTYTIKVRYKFVGRLQPRRYDLGDLFDDEDAPCE